MTRIRAAVSGAIALTLTPMPAFADDGMTTLETVGVFVLLPMSIWGVIWLLWSIPQWRRQAASPTVGQDWTPAPKA